MGEGGSSSDEHHLVGRAAAQIREADPQPSEAAVAGSIARKGADGYGSTDVASCCDDCLTDHAIQDTAPEVSDAQEPLPWWDMCLRDLTVAGAAPAFPQRAGVFDTPAKTTVARFCLLRGNLLILVL